MVLSFFDLEDVRSFLDLLLPLSPRTELAQHGVVRNALMSALIVSYGRPFARSHSDGHTARQLPADLIDGLSESQRNTHKRLLELRNEEFAHTDPEPVDLRVIWEVRDKGFRFPVPVSNVTRIGLSDSELGEVRELLNYIDQVMIARYAALGEDLIEDADD